VASVSETALYPMIRSGLSVDPDRPMIGMKREKVVEIRYMFMMSGINRDRRWMISHFQSESKTK
jgi:hypothetical protein